MLSLQPAPYTDCRQEASQATTSCKYLLCEKWLGYYFIFCKVSSPLSYASITPPSKISSTFSVPPGLSCHSLSPLTCRHCLREQVCMHAYLQTNVIKCAHACACACAITRRSSSQSERTYELTDSWLHQKWQFSPCSYFTFLSPPPPHRCRASLGPHTLKCGSMHTDLRVWHCVVSVFVVAPPFLSRGVRKWKPQTQPPHICHVWNMTDEKFWVVTIRVLSVTVKPIPVKSESHRIRRHTVSWTMRLHFILLLPNF